MTFKTARKIYLAGPEVFLADAVGIGGKKKEICATHGFEGVFPLDNSFDDQAFSDDIEKAHGIYRANVALMLGCDLVIANCTPFRGASMDIGTGFEMGFMAAQGRGVFGYSNVLALYADRARGRRSVFTEHGLDGDLPSTEVEDFGLPENLMITGAIAGCCASMVLTEVAEDALLTDLEGFERCVELAVEWRDG